MEGWIQPFCIFSRTGFGWWYSPRPKHVAKNVKLKWFTPKLARLYLFYKLYWKHNGKSPPAIIRTKLTTRLHTDLRVFPCVYEWRTVILLLDKKQLWTINSQNDTACIQCTFSHVLSAARWIMWSQLSPNTKINNDLRNAQSLPQSVVIYSLHYFNPDFIAA
jgi:hypothetical protein